MNIESLLVKIELFEEFVIDSGFKRDMAAFSQALQQNHNRNLVFAQNLSQKIKSHLILVNENSLDSELDILLKDSESFTKLNTFEKLNDLDSNGEIATNHYIREFTEILNNLISKLDSNTKEINSIKKVFKKYSPTNENESTVENKVLMSLIFKDLKTTGSLKAFSKSLNKWDRTLLIYHTLLKSEPPKEISLVEIQNGSIDVIFNIDLDIAVDLTKIVYAGLQGCAAYLLYKVKGKEMMNSFKNNKQLMQLEEQKEKLMLDNIKDSVKQLVLEQHRERLKLDSKIDITSLEKKADEVSNVITEHIIKGNEVKLLSPPKIEEEEDFVEDNEIHPKKLRAVTTTVRERYKKLDEDDKLALLDKYTIKEVEEKKSRKK